MLLSTSQSKKWIQPLAIIAVIIFSAPLLANPCASTTNIISNGGVGGTGIKLGNGVGGTGIDQGVGGTGINKDQGVGGTGIEKSEGLGGTGIVGVITGFGSICIGELEVHIDQKTPVQIDGVLTKEHQFSIGQMVAIDAVEKDSRIMATKIQIFHQVIGPITAIDFKKNVVKVMNQNISAKPSLIKNLIKGQWVGVSGLRNNSGELQTTLINTNIKVKKAMIIGNLVKRDGKNLVGGTNIIGMDKPTFSNINEEVKVSGSWDGKNLKAENVTAGPGSTIMKRVEHLYVQTILPPQSEKQVVNVAGKMLPIERSRTHKLNEPVLLKLKISKEHTNIENIHSIKNTILNQDRLNHTDTNEPKKLEPIRQKEHQKLRPEPSLNHKHETRYIERHEKVEIQHIEKPEKVEFEKPEKIEFEKPEKIEFEKPEKIEFEKPEKIEFEKPEKIEFEKPEKIEFEKPEKIEFEKPEKIEFEKPEKIEFEKPE
jgi:hypothetical protein